MSDLEHARSMLRVAQRDLRSLKAIEALPEFADEQAGFLAQQAAEKALKAWLASLGHADPYTHDLAALLNALRDCGRDIDEFWSLVDYSPYAVELRYGEEGSGEEPLDRSTAIARVGALIDRVSVLLERCGENQD